MADGSTKWVNGPLGNIEKSLNNVSESLSHMFDGENNNARRYNRK